MTNTTNDEDNNDKKHAEGLDATTIKGNRTEEKVKGEGTN